MEYNKIDFIITNIKKYNIKNNSHTISHDITIIAIFYLFGGKMSNQRQSPMFQSHHLTFKW